MQYGSSISRHPAAVPVPVPVVAAAAAAAVAAAAAREAATATAAVAVVAAAAAAAAVEAEAARTWHDGGICWVTLPSCPPSRSCLALPTTATFLLSIGRPARVVRLPVVLLLPWREEGKRTYG